MIGKRKSITFFHKRQKRSEISRTSKENWNQRMISINEKKQSKKRHKIKEKNYSEKTAFANLKKASSTETTLRRSSSGIPKYVADRMARRIFFTAGIPTILGMSVFVVSYIIVTRNIAEIPPSSTIAISALFFLLGLAGLSFGILSASWDKEPGSFFGIENIPMNIQRAKSSL